MKPTDEVFVEGEFYNINTFWHIKVPCIYHADTKLFKASVDIIAGRKFRFFTVDPTSKKKSVIFSDSYIRINEFDNSEVHILGSIENLNTCNSNSTHSSKDSCNGQLFNLPQSKN